MGYILMADSGCDLTQEQLSSLQIECVDLLVHIPNSEKNVYKITDLEMKEFYSYLRSDISIHTSSVNVGVMHEVMEQILTDGNDILYLGFDSALSCTFHNAVIAAGELRHQYPDRKIYTIDTLCASLGLGLLVSLTAEKRLAGFDIESAKQFAESTAPRICHWFTVDDLNFLKKGGRLSASVAAVGKMLNIKPILHNDSEGHLTPCGKAHGRKKSLCTLIDKVRQGAENPSEQHMMICHGDCIEDALWLRSQLIEQLRVKKVDIGYIGPVIASHAGPGTISVFYIGSNR